jgi:hypothetical protein
MSYDKMPIHIGDMDALVKQLHCIRDATTFRIANLNQPLQCVFDKCRQLDIAFDRVGPRTWKFVPRRRRVTSVADSTTLVVSRGLSLFFALMFVVVVVRGPATSAWALIESKLQPYAVLSNIVATAICAFSAYVARKQLLRVGRVFLGVVDGGAK